MNTTSLFADITLRDGPIHLRAVEARDYEPLYRLASDPVTSLRWRYRGSTPSPEDFRAKLWTNVTAQFVVEMDVHSTSGGNRLVGLVSLYNASFKNGIAYLGALGAPSIVESGAMIAAIALLIDYAFANWNFRKLYFETLEWNTRSVASGTADFFTIEGRMTEVEYFRGRYWDLSIASITRDRWLSVGAVNSQRQAAVGRLLQRYSRGAPNEGNEDQQPDQFSNETQFIQPASLEEFLELVSLIANRQATVDDTLVTDLALDSLQMLELFTAVEELTARPLQLPDESFIASHTVRDLFLFYCRESSMPPTIPEPDHHLAGEARPI